MLGKTIDGRYEIESRLGQGGMGTVYRGIQTAIGRPVAIKVLTRALAHDAQAVQRFMQEARAASSLSHANTITIHDFGQTGNGLLYLVMELVEGRTLAELVEAEGALPFERARRIIVGILDALEAAHSQQIIHRDLKPDNVILTDGISGNDRVKVLDFGLAKLIGDDGDGKQLTQTGQVFGTPAYMSPEQAQGERCDLRTDLYSLGVIAYEMLAGQRPFGGESPLSLLIKHLQSEPPRFDTLTPPARVGPALQAFVDRALAKSRDDRFQSADEMRAAVNRAFETDSGGVSAVTGSRSDSHGQARSSETLGSGIVGEISRLPLEAVGISSDSDSGRTIRRWQFALAAIAGVVAIAGTAAWLGGASIGSDDPPASSAQPTSTEPVTVAVPTAPVTVTTDADAAAETPRIVILRFRTDPDGASLKLIEKSDRGGKLEVVAQRTLGTVPRELEVTAGRTVVATFSKGGYKSRIVELVATRDKDMDLVLEPELPPKPKRIERRRPPRPRKEKSEDRPPTDRPAAPPAAPLPPDDLK